jgi:hypothetical protein
MDAGKRCSDHFSYEPLRVLARMKATENTAGMAVFFCARILCSQPKGKAGNLP